MIIQRILGTIWMRFTVMPQNVHQSETVGYGGGEERNKVLILMMGSL